MKWARTRQQQQQPHCAFRRNHPQHHQHCVQSTADWSGHGKVRHPWVSFHRRVCCQQLVWWILLLLATSTATTTTTTTAWQVSNTLFRRRTTISNRFLPATFRLAAARTWSKDIPYRQQSWHSLARQPCGFSKKPPPPPTSSRLWSQMTLGEKERPLIAIVAASEKERGIGYQGQLPWKLREDMQHFARVTTGKGRNAVIMGRKTWDSIPPKFRPLPNRLNVVLSRTLSPTEFPPGVLHATSLDHALQLLDGQQDLDEVFVMGGAQVYQEAMDRVCKIILTQVVVPTETTKKTMQFDAFFPALTKAEWECRMFQEEGDRSKEEGYKVDAKSGLSFCFLEYTRRRPASPRTVTATTTTRTTRRGLSSMALQMTSTTAEDTPPTASTSVPLPIPEGPDVNPQEMQYLDLIRDILDTGMERGDRTGVGTISKFGTQMRFNLRNNTMPLLTTKRTFWRGVAEEMLWFISGSTNANVLASKGIHIWDGNGSREFLDQRGLSHREVGDLGPVYGFQWRHFGAKYQDMHTDYTGQGVDQLADCIHKIRNNPQDRRIVMSAWNPADLQEMALPPCHMFCQFYVDTTRRELSCQMYQRSADMGLGVPFNIASYALLTHLVAFCCDLQAGELVHTIGDAHVYKTHVEALEVQLARPPRAFPKLFIGSKRKRGNCTMDDFTMDDLTLVGYQPHGKIAMEMAV